VPLSRAYPGPGREVPLGRACQGRSVGDPFSGAHGECGRSYHGHQDVHHQHQSRVGGDHEDEKGKDNRETERALKEEIEQLKLELQSKGVDLERASRRPGEEHQHVGAAQPNQNDGTMNSTRELPEFEGEVTPITLGDWLVTIGPVMKDITPVSSEWWEVTRREAEKAYMVWRQATLMERVSFCPGLPVELSGQKYLRTEQRGVGLVRSVQLIKTQTGEPAKKSWA